MNTLTKTTRLTKTTFKFLLLFMAIPFLTHCGAQKFDTQSNTDSATLGSNSPQTTPKTPNSSDSQRKSDLAKIIDNTDVNSYLDTGALVTDPSKPVVEFNKQKGEFIMHVPLGSFALGVGFEYASKEYPGIRVYSETIKNRPVVSVAVPVKYITGNITTVPAKLPNGDSVPFFPAGEPPSIGLLLTPTRAEKVYLFISPEAFGVFIETNFDPIPDNFPFINYFELRNKAKTKIVGYLGMVDQKSPFKGGFFMSHKIDPKFGKILEEYYLD